MYMNITNSIGNISSSSSSSGIHLYLCYFFIYRIEFRHQASSNTIGTSIFSQAVLR